ncbi:MAG: hypothetical protein RhofKO_14500 [Rhodothermales bacterium]
MTDKDLIRLFTEDPDQAYTHLLEKYSSVLIRMIHKFVRDHDEVMEVYTSICERLRARDFQALRRFRVGSDLLPWFSVIVANACRDQYRKRRALSMPQSVINQLEPAEKLVFKYYFQERYTYEEILEYLISRHQETVTLGDVRRAVEKIYELLSVSKRWHLIAAIRANLPVSSMDEMLEAGVASKSFAQPDDESEFDPKEVAVLKDALADLDPELQLIVKLRFEQEMKAPEIARVMRYEKSKMVYSKLRTAIQRLRRAFGDPD